MGVRTPGHRPSAVDCPDRTDRQPCATVAATTGRPRPARSGRSGAAGGDTGGGDSGGGGTDPRFATCTAAKRAGYGPYVRGQDPEYAWYDDRDGDGRVCE
ncbi:excalibur calcium-binding domain-containing protein [Micromonospora sp. URMC 103]|uniref:excalibur calcium-binding domain-containing protein n=1 Tax=Micromonospora sp. URMC 103 TaxID=3423406 RepID=UPI003F1B27EE